MEYFKHCQSSTIIINRKKSVGYAGRMPPHSTLQERWAVLEPITAINDLKLHTN